MKDIQSRLRAGDPVVREGGASSAASERMRHRILSGIRDVRPAPRRLVPALAVAMLLFAVGAAWMTNHMLRLLPTAEPRIDSVRDAREVSESRQLQFFTPGGTRVLWTLHPKREAR
jgi:hypothetical protein